MHRCGCEGDLSGKKERKKILKAGEQLANLIGRKDLKEADAANELYNVVADGIEKVAKMRQAWEARENDDVFYSLKKDWRPMQVPLTFSVASNGDGSSPKSSNADKIEKGISPMPGNADQLLIIARKLRQFGEAYIENRGKKGESFFNLPGFRGPATLAEGATSTAEVTMTTEALPQNWVGFSTKQIGKQ